MAIVRPGIRIGGIDVRVGIPRDITQLLGGVDKRLKQKPGGNPESNMGRFIAMVNEAEGFARSNRFYVEFTPPGGLIKEITRNNIFRGNTVGQDDEVQGFTPSQHISQTYNVHGRRIQAFANKLSMPDRKMTMTAVKHSGPARKFVTDVTYDDITVTFYSDKFLRERQFFEMWQKCAYSDVTHNFNYYDDYVGRMNIFQLGQFASKQERDDITYSCGLIDVYPSSVGEIQYSYGAESGIVNFDVTFSYRKWYNYSLEGADPEVGQPEFREITTKEAQAGGLFGGILNKLPPVLKTPARGVIEDLSRRLPIGKITGGKVFPPFKIPPIRL